MEPATWGVASSMIPIGKLPSIILAFWGRFFSSSSRGRYCFPQGNATTTTTAHREERRRNGGGGNCKVRRPTRRGHSQLLLWPSPEASGRLATRRTACMNCHTGIPMKASASQLHGIITGCQPTRRGRRTGAGRYHGPQLRAAASALRPRPGENQALPARHSACADTVLNRPGPLGAGLVPTLRTSCQLILLE